MSTSETLSASAASAEVWAEIDRNLAYWNAPGEGDVALEVWSYFNGKADVPAGYAIIPLLGSWADVRAAVLSGELMRRFTRGSGIEAEAMAVNVYENGAWYRKAVWSKESDSWAVR